MTNRERAMNILRGKPFDRFPAVHFGYWPELLAEWAEQGYIPKELTENHDDGNEKDKEQRNEPTTNSSKVGLYI